MRRSGQHIPPKPAPDIVGALRNIRRPSPDPVAIQKPPGTWKGILGVAVGIGVALLAAFAAIDVHPYESGNSAI